MRLRVHWSTLGLGALAAGLIAVAILQGRSLETDVVEPGAAIRFGESLPTEFQSFTGDQPGRLEGACWVMFIVDRDCSACRELMRRERDRDVDLGRANLLWASVSSREDTEALIDDTGVVSSAVALVVRPATLGARQALASVGLNSTPTRLVVDQRRRVKDLRLTWSIPGDAELSEFCAA